MKRTAIGLVGPIASGKGEVVKYLKNLGFICFSLSDRVREEAFSLGIPPQRENLQNIGNSLRNTFGSHILAERSLELLSGDEELLVFDGLRNPSEIEFLCESLDIHIIGINASEENRLKWYLERAGIRGEDGLTEADFHLANNRDLGQSEPESGQQVSVCLEMADEIIQNDGSKRHLREAVDYLLISEFGISPEGLRHSKEK
ncbi:MAG: hypothetical protein UW68_C0010G0012 [Candidatus Collierbacteria bacterium GW2011_GWB1_44_6]|uniref:Dephospho-CoA kinase n=2 Tax=Candidatus Collieribacteriota TaxID=1752725 RepID=A0A0G1JPC4_9BACT|nr:MAG: hypothetical protein UV68_C0005G0020 [Candidatus Collierbacteria bacterium GW2011_GWC2_43_12]KKT73401.1 MAG: hypothetical protein UW68_C0010G0012 [Candidatus Collierbacteria bacterium GW2011_GWB1_44_6]